MHLSVTVREHGGYPLNVVAVSEPLPPEGGGAALTRPIPATAANKQSLFISASFAGASRRVYAPTLIMPWPLNDLGSLWLQPPQEQRQCSSACLLPLREPKAPIWR
jgi:hypothetical protein